MRQKLAEFQLAFKCPGVSEFKEEPEEPLQGFKMTVMDILEFTDIKNVTSSKRMLDELEFK